MTALFTPMSIGGVELRNRIVMPSMTTRLADREGYVTDATVAYFKARAAGGTGLITVEMASPERVGRHRARELERACKQDGVTFKYGFDVSKLPEVLRDYDRIVVATGAKYRFGCGPIIYWLLERQWGKSQLMRKLFSSERLRDWFYYRARRATGGRYGALTRPGQKIAIIGDAAQAGKGKEAIASAFRTAYFAD